MIQTEADLIFFLVTDKFVIGTPAAIARSERTIDLSFDDFVQDKNVQERARLSSSAYVGHPDQNWARTFCATYLAAFASENQTERRKYLLDNRTVRILWLDDQKPVSP